METKLETAARALEARLAAMRAVAAARQKMTADQIDAEFETDTKLLETLSTRVADVGGAITEAAKRKGNEKAANFGAELAEHGAAHLRHMTAGQAGPAINTMNDAADKMVAAATDTRGVVKP
jgi:hypothetical protein